MTTMISKVKPLVTDKAEKSDWYESWFNSPYYHILYKNRDEKEAELFLDALIGYIKPEPGARILDVACGKGRHSLYLNRKNFDVTGFDLSSESIVFTKQFENDKLNFYLHDMREVFRSNYYDIVLNLFSSFGYFEKERDNERCLIANATALKPGGTFVFDFFNVNKVLESPVSETVFSIDGIDFHIEKRIENNFVKKRILFSDQGIDFVFEEQVLLAGKEEFEKYFTEAGLQIFQTFGSYKLENFDPYSSDRLILLARKK